jgi:hypothetical protein
MAAIAALFVAPVSVVAAEQDVTVQLVGTHLVAKGAVVNVEVQYSCTRLTDPEPPDVALYEETFVDVTIQQVVGGRRQAHGNNAVWFGGDEDCDGSLHALTVPVPADPSGLAFKSGAAAITVTGKASYGWYHEYEGMGWYQYEFFNREVTIDWMQIKLSK